MTKENSSLLPNQISFTDKYNQLGNFIEFVPDAVILVDQSGNISQINTQAEVMFQYSRGELLGKPIELLLPAQQKQIHIEHRPKYLATPKTRSMGEAFNLEAVRKDGSLFPVDISLSPIPTNDGHFVIAAVRDITKSQEAKKRGSLGIHGVSSYMGVS